MRDVRQLHLLILLTGVWLPAAIAADEPVYERYTHYAVGDYLPWHFRAATQGDTPPFKTVDADELTQVQHLTICRLLGVAPIWLRSFRWGEALSPEGHPLHGTTWLRVVSGPRSDVVMMRYDRTGKIVYHSLQQRRPAPSATGIIMMHDSWVPNTFAGSEFLDWRAIDRRRLPHSTPGQ